MANGGIKPFGNIPDILGQAAQQRLSPQFAQQQLEMQNAIASQTRQNLASQFLATADFVNNPGRSLITLGSIMGDTGVVERGIQTLTAQRLQNARREALRTLAGEARQIAPGGTTPEERTQFFGAALEAGEPLIGLPAGTEAPNPFEMLTEQLQLQTARARAREAGAKAKRAEKDIAPFQSLREMLDDLQAGKKVDTKLFRERSRDVVGSLLEEVNLNQKKIDDLIQQTKTTLDPREKSEFRKQIDEVRDTNRQLQDNIKQIRLIQTETRGGRLKAGPERTLLERVPVLQRQETTGVPGITDTQIRQQILQSQGPLDISQLRERFDRGEINADDVRELHRQGKIETEEAVAILSGG